MKSLHVVLGLAWLASVSCFVASLPWGWWGVLGCAIASLWYVPFGLVTCVLETGLLLLPA